jgi:acyl carrier protein
MIHSRGLVETRSGIIPRQKSQPGVKMKDEIIQKTGTYIANEILKQSKRVISPDQKLISSGLIDSFSLVDLALFVEDTFNVHLDDSELNKETFDTLDQLADLIESRAG